MRISLVNPQWDFEGSIYFGCREPHLPLELGYSQALLSQSGHDVLLVDGHLEHLSHSQVRDKVAAFAPEMIVVPTAPSYLFWRCPPPEVRVPQELIRVLREIPAQIIAVGPHGSTTPRAALQKLGADVVVIGECEEVLVDLAAKGKQSDSICYWDAEKIVVRGPNRVTDMKQLPALRWPTAMVGAHSHHHHRFDSFEGMLGAEVESSRGCPYHCTFCAKDNFRNNYRKRPHSIVFEEVDELLRQGVGYVYFIDEIFLPDLPLLTGLAERNIKIGVQTRIDLWNEQAIDALARAGCVSVEAGVESITEEGRAYLDKKCKLSTDELSQRLIYAKKSIAFVQANLLSMAEDEGDAVEAWRMELEAGGVWANKPVPLFPYPGSPEYTRMWGAPDDRAWERAHDLYLNRFTTFSDIQEHAPQALIELESLRYGR